MPFHLPTADDLAGLEARTVDAFFIRDWRNSAWCEDGDHEQQVYAPGLPDSPTLKPEVESGWGFDDSALVSEHVYARWQSGSVSGSTPNLHELRTHHTIYSSETGLRKPPQPCPPVRRHVRDIEPLYLPAASSPIPPSPPPSSYKFAPHSPARLSWQNRRQAVYLDALDGNETLSAEAELRSEPLQSHHDSANIPPSSFLRLQHRGYSPYNAPVLQTPGSTWSESNAPSLTTRPSVRSSRVSIASTAETPSLSHCSSSAISAQSFLNTDEDDSLTVATHTSTLSLPNPRSPAKHRPARWSFTPSRSTPSTPSNKPKRSASAQAAPPTAYQAPQPPRLRKQTSAKLIKLARPTPPRLATSQLSPSMPSPSAHSFFPEDPFGRPGAVSPVQSIAPSISSVEAAAAAWVPDWVDADVAAASSVEFGIQKTPVRDSKPRASRRNRVARLLFGWTTADS